MGGVDQLHKPYFLQKHHLKNIILYTYKKYSHADLKYRGKNDLKYDLVLKS